MIVEYHRPKSVHEALILLAREKLKSYPLGGGTFLNRRMENPIAVVDLQALGLGSIEKKGNLVHIGATATLQNLLDFEELPEDIYKAIEHEATYNLRQMATIAGTLVTADGRSPLATIFLALNASLEVQELEAKPKDVRIGDWLPLREKSQPGRLIIKIALPINVRVVYAVIARTPADQPIVSAALAQWTSGRTRLTLGGWGSSPILVMDGPDSEGIELAAKNAYKLAEDEWASAEYRQEMAGVLALRCLKRIGTR
jgi:putative selenate reductase FAD-binding subunit